MFTTSLDTFRIQQKDLHQQAEHYRLVKSLEQPNQWVEKLYASIGRMLILSGEELINRTLAAH